MNKGIQSLEFEKTITHQKGSDVVPGLELGGFLKFIAMLRGNCKSLCQTE